jgi:hypothetical protein
MLSTPGGSAREEGWTTHGLLPRVCGRSTSHSTRPFEHFSPIHRAYYNYYRL